MEDLHKQVTKAMIDNINKIFEDENPAKLSGALEVFIALLRNKQNTKPVDVELFFADHSKLVSKMAKHETTYCSLETVRWAETEIGRVRQLQLEPNYANLDISSANIFLDWSSAFCAAAKIDLSLKHLEKEIVDLRLDLERSNLKIERFRKIKAD